MRCPDTEYIRNLEYFLQHSNEDEADARYFLRRFDDAYQGNWQLLKWLDVGAGPGTKPIQILKGIGKDIGLLQRASALKLSILEPSEEWQRILAENFQKAKLKTLISEKHQTTWEEFNSPNKYDLITFFHSVYGITTETLGKIPQYLQENGTACIVVESPNSDLHLIKKRIFPYVHHQELVSSSDTITSFLERKRIKYSIDREETKQRFYVDDILDINNPNRTIPLSFILQTKPEDQDKITSKAARKKIEEELRKYVKFDGDSSYINVPDRFIWIYN